MKRTHQGPSGQTQRLLLLWAVIGWLLQAVATTYGADTALPTTLAELLRLRPADLKSQDIARVNLICAEGLSGAEGMELAACLKTLDQWAERVRSATQQHFHRFQSQPEQFEHSEPYFRMLVLVTVMQRELGVRYNAKWMGATPSAGDSQGRFFGDAQDVFVHGLVGERRSGTCASMPVLYVSVGRRLGYPLRLVAAKSHLFVRWEEDGGGKRMNIEASSKGLVTHPDAFYRHWPGEITTAEVETGQYLKSLEPVEELAEFLVLRACCQMSQGSDTVAVATLEAAARLVPGCERYQAALRNHKVQGEIGP